jgi:hypothetical protein
MPFWSMIWDTIWWFLTVFVFVVYLFALFAIIGDLFRDQKLSGFAKAIWLIFLMFVPFLTALIYLIARGNGMAERSAAQRRAGEEAAQNYIRSVASSSPAHEIEQARALLAAGAITQAEFDTLKAKALS